MNNLVILICSLLTSINAWPPQSDIMSSVKRSAYDTDMKRHKQKHQYPIASFIHNKSICELACMDKMSVIDTHSISHFGCVGVSMLACLSIKSYRCIDVFK